MKYRTIVVDPPWPLKWRSNPAVGMKPLDYATMPIAEIAELPILELAADDCALFLWTTNSFLPEALGIVRIWKFEYRMLWTWCKPTGMGAHPRNATEHIVLAYRGPVRQVLDRHAPQTLNWTKAPTTVHSEKPEVFIDTIEAISPAPRVELFARRNRLGWDTWGNEALNHVELRATP
jgi:N6-adenosine-specific RNA methylase IME4